jgi:diguanylate cyclase (GGDEF)-like protein
VAIKIAVIGANPANVEEIKNVVVESLAGSVEVETSTIDRYRHLTPKDLYVCLVNRKDQMEEAFGPDKVIALEFEPPVEYFLSLSRVPAGTNVLIFNNSLAGTRVLMSRLNQYDLMHLNYDIVAYDEMDYNTVAKKIASATFITGGSAYVGPEKDLYEFFGAYLSPDATVLVSPPRHATPDSISRLCHAFSRLQHDTVMEELQRLADFDYLTQIPNRRNFDETLSLEWKRAQRDSTLLSVAMLDIDFFKNYNDHYGHRSGDQCLQAIASALKDSLHRPADFCARYGGEEFAVILPNTDLTGAMKVLESMRQSVINLDIRHGFSTVSPVITVSAGCTCTVPSLGATSELALQIADKALYQAKLQGRNKVVFQQFFSHPYIQE